MSFACFIWQIWSQLIETGKTNKITWIRTFQNRSRAGNTLKLNLENLEWIVDFWEFRRDGWLLCQEGNILPQSRICVLKLVTHISNSCWTDTKSFRTQFFKAQISFQNFLEILSIAPNITLSLLEPVDLESPDMFWTNFVTN